MEQQKVFIHSFILAAAVFLSFLWVSNSILVGFSLQLTGILILTLIVSRHILKPDSFHLAESTISSIAVLLLTSTTGGLSSPLFFLNYFLLFELSLLLEPIIPLVLSSLLILYYFFTHDAANTPIHLVELLAFPFMTPLAYLFGKIYKKEENQKLEIKHLAKRIEELEEELVEKEVKKNK